MRILQATAFYAPSIGGIQSYVSELTAALGSRGHRVDILTVNTEGAPERERTPTGVVRRCRLDRSYHRGLVSLELAAALLRARRYDVLHLHIPFPFGLEAAAVGSRLNGVPLVVTHHGTGGKADALYTLIAGAYDVIFRNISLRAVDRIVFLTQSYGESIALPREMYARSAVVRTPAVAEAIDHARESRQVRSSLGMTPHDFVGVWVGSLNEHNRYKGLEVLLSALACPLGRTIRLLVVGDGTLRAELEVQAAALQVSSRVVFAGAIDRSRLGPFYQAGDFFVLPSVSGPENSPLAVFEAMVAGLPVIASALPGISEIVIGDVNGLLVPPGDERALASAMARLQENAALRRGLGERARAYALGQTWEDCAVQMEDVYQSLPRARYLRHG